MSAEPFLIPAEVLAALDDPYVCKDRTDRGACRYCVEDVVLKLRTFKWPVERVLADIAEFRARKIRESGAGS